MSIDISEERIEQAAKALFMVCSIRWAPTWADANDRVKDGFRKEARAALESDAPFFAAERARGVREARDSLFALKYEGENNDIDKGYNRAILDALVAIDGRLSALAKGEG